MVTAPQQLDKRFEKLRPFAANAARPSRGWIKAIREALGLTQAQFAKRLGVHQPRVIEMETGEATGKITVHSLERAAEALGCQLVYVLIPRKPLTDTLRQQAESIAGSQLAAVEQTMLLEAQSVEAEQLRRETKQRIVDELLKKPARLWDAL